MVFPVKKNNRSISNETYFDNGFAFTIQSTRLPYPNLVKLVDEEINDLHSKLRKVFPSGVNVDIVGGDTTDTVRIFITFQVMKVAKEGSGSENNDAEAPKIDGGIDLDAKNMGLDVIRDGKGIEMNFDPAMVAEFQKGNFTGVEGIILRIVPIRNPLMI
jgi:hypothetical protein